MDDGGVRSAVESLLATELSVADHGELAAASRAVGRLQSFVDLAKVQIARRGRALAGDGDRSSEHVLIDEARCSGTDAKATNDRDRVCGTLPEFEAALANGDVTAAHLDAMGRHTKGLTDEERADLALVVDDLVASAVTQPAGLFDKTSKAVVDRIRAMHRPDSDTDELDRQRAASLVKRWTDRESGMKHTLISLDPLRDASLHAVIDAHLSTLRQDPANQQRSFEELKVEAVMTAIADGPSGSLRVPELVIHADAGSLCHGRHDQTLCETADGQPVPVPTARRLCCEAVLQAVIVNPDGRVDRLCAELRTASRAQRRMLEAMYATCAHPLCEVGFSRCRMHHVVWFSHGGKTELANLLPLCEAHHHLVHEGRWDLTIDDQRTVTWHRPDGSTWKTVPMRDSSRRTGGRPTGRASPSAA